MSAQTIYDELRRAGMTHEGACAMLGNMQCESGLKANIAQRGMTSLTDAQYTKLFDTNPERCISDSVGYGLCQWTYPQRKRNLRRFARNWGVSVGAEDMQTAFAVDELKTEYAALWKYLCETDELYTATERICKEYERPAVNNVQARFDVAQKFSAMLQNTQSEAKSDMTVLIIQALLVLRGYSVELNGRGDGRTLEALRDYMKTMEEK